jgi:hypothetical protein
MFKCTTVLSPTVTSALWRIVVKWLMVIFKAITLTPKTDKRLLMDFQIAPMDTGTPTGDRRSKYCTMRLSEVSRALLAVYLAVQPRSEAVTTPPSSRSRVKSPVGQVRRSSTLVLHKASFATTGAGLVKHQSQPERDYRGLGYRQTTAIPTVQLQPTPQTPCDFTPPPHYDNRFATLLSVPCGNKYLCLA